MARAIGQRAVVLDQAFEGFPGEVEAVEIGVAPLERSDDMKRLGVVIEAAEQAQALVALVEDEHLGLISQPPERRRMDDAVAVAAEIAPRRARRLGIEPTAAVRRVGRIGRRRNSRGRHEKRPNIRSLTLAAVALTY